MGLERVIATQGVPSLAKLLERLAAAGVASSLMMVDNALVSPKLPPPSEWRDVRLKTPAGAVTLKRRADGVAVIVFGNADPALLAAQTAVADALASLA
jgi:hypothetical protein